jgi:hypothetical protein
MKKNKGGSKRFRQGFFKPINPKKYLGDPTNIVYRSSWELKVLKQLDLSSKVLAYGSEEIKIPYISPIDNKYHTYFMDFIVITKEKKVILIEVKPHSQTIPPRKTQTKTEQRLLLETKTYLVNRAKWKATEEYCEKKGWSFLILTEKNINFT